ncbi:hypothetical protein FD41_GL000449 [Lentilactobacillus farraginis DSM 18382 = JCM 14108]|uniref:Uncharacterized protein n=1 Tax=Lentilactobacillus farraginis DSM 18382 = JCM 14108 TaxID=1423743 RepID=A0A0R1VWR1_9LACO|nr:hypothetical protein FD41_GL000449 [Lentilactobacillus farraginis DSM 18382 = JCM 14108]
MTIFFAGEIMSFIKNVLSVCLIGVISKLLFGDDVNSYGRQKAKLARLALR